MSIPLIRSLLSNQVFFSQGRVNSANSAKRRKAGRSAFKIVTGKPTEKIPLGRHRRRWEDNIRMDLKYIGINPRN